jgi:hypothetical protein
MIAKDQTFEDITISLDGGSFYNCTFRRCKLQFSALLPVVLTGCHFDNCNWEFAGPAVNTVGFLAAMYKGGATEIVERTFRVIRGEQSGSPILMRQ